MRPPIYVSRGEAERLLRELHTTEGGDYHLINRAVDLAFTVIEQSRQIDEIRRDLNSMLGGDGASAVEASG